MISRFRRFYPAAQVLITGCILCSFQAAAQTPPAPFTRDQLNQTIPQGSPLPREEAPGALPVVPPLNPQIPAGENQAPATPEPVRNVVVEGVTAYPKSEIDEITKGLVGPAVTLNVINETRLNLLRKYRDDGYPLVSVDARYEAQTGALRFIVSEGRIADVKLEPKNSGDTIGPEGVQVLRFLRRLTEERPVRAASLERAILLAQSIPGLTVTTVLLPSEQEAGALTIVAQVARQALTGTASVDNRAFQNTGREEGFISLDLNSFTSLGEKTELTLFKTPLNPTQIFGQAEESFFVGGSGLRVSLYGGAGVTNPNGSLGQDGYEGVTNVFGASVSYPVILTRDQRLTVIGKFDATDSQVFTGQHPHTQFSVDDVRAARLIVDEELSDQWIAGQEATTEAAVRISQGAPGLFGASVDGRNNAGRTNERFQFQTVNVLLDRDQTIFKPLPNARVSLFGLIAGQFASDVLPPAEQFYLGGLRYTRGFYSGQVSGDNGLAVTAELRLTLDQSVTVFGHELNLRPQFYGFYDWGETWENQASDPNHKLVSVGGGLRLTVSRNTEIDFEGVQRLTRNITASTSVKPLAKSAFYWRVLTQF